MDQHVFDQWSVSHLVWGFTLGFLVSAPRSVAAWKIGLIFVLWELWENVIEVAFSTYAPGEYHGDSLVNSVFDMLPSMTGVWLGRHVPTLWPAIVIAEAWATSMGFGIHSVFLGHQGSICDVRADPSGCGQAYVLRLVLMPWLFCAIERSAWRAYAAERASDFTPQSSPVLKHRAMTAAVSSTPEKSPSNHLPFNPTPFKL